MTLGEKKTLEHEGYLKFENNCDCENLGAKVVKVPQFRSLQIWCLLLSNF